MGNLFRKAILKVTPTFYNKFYKRNNKQEKVTFISQNCIGGVLYHMLGMQFSSPTINMFIEDENFVKLCENPQHYFSVDAEPYEECHVDSNDKNLRYPIIKVDDILLCCQHYENCEEAVKDWNKRRLRVDYNKIFVISCSWNLHERADLVERINNLPYPSIIFTTEDYNFSRCVRLVGDKWTKTEGGIVKPSLTGYDGITGKRYFCDVFDFIQWINESSLL